MSIWGLIALPAVHYPTRPKSFIPQEFDLVGVTLFEESCPLFYIVSPGQLKLKTYWGTSRPVFGPSSDLRRHSNRSFLSDPKSRQLARAKNLAAAHSASFTTEVRERRFAALNFFAAENIDQSAD